MRGKLLWFFILFFLFLSGQTLYCCQASDGTNVSCQLLLADTDNTLGSMMEEFDYQEIQEVLNEGSGVSFNFGDYITDVISGKEALSFSSIWNAVKKTIASQLSGITGTFRKILIVAVLSALFTNFSYTFRNSQAAETGFFVTYLLLYGILAAAYMTVAQIAGQALTSLLEFMKVMVPVYSVSVAFSTGAGTSAVIYQAVLVLITVVDVVLLKVVLPMIHLYMMAMLANHLTQEDTLSKFADLLATLAGWILKTLLALVIGIGAIQGMLAPALDHVKNTTVMKWISAIPGIGGLLGGVTETVLGAGTLLRNAIGAAGVIAICAICFLPVIKLGAGVLLYKAGGAVIQPIADRRVLACLESCAGASQLLLKTVFTGVLLFLISIVVACT